MFPSLNKNIEFESPSDFWGGMEVPPYKKMKIHINDGSVLIAEKIRKIGKDCSGFIEEENINFHIMYDKKYHTDYNRTFVFIYFKDILFVSHLPYNFILSFLQYKSNKMLLVYENVCFLIKKSDETCSICAELDKIYSDSGFFEENIISKVGSITASEIMDNLYHNLISEYLKNNEMKEFNLKNDINVLTQILKLRVD